MNFSFEYPLDFGNFSGKSKKENKKTNIKRAINWNIKRNTKKKISKGYNDSKSEKLKTEHRFYGCPFDL
jgi:hypothetical protein